MHFPCLVSQARSGRNKIPSLPPLEIGLLSGGSQTSLIRNSEHSYALNGSAPDLTTSEIHSLCSPPTRSAVTRLCLALKARLSSI